MATVETTKNPLGNLFVSEDSKTIEYGFTADASGYQHGEIVKFDTATSTFAKCTLGTDSADGVVYGGVDANGTKGIVVRYGVVRESLLVGFDGLDAATKGAVRGQLMNKNIWTKDV